MLTSRAREDSSNLVRCRPTRASLWGSQRGRRSGGSSLVREAVCVQAAHRVWIGARRAGGAAWNNQVRALPKHQAAAQPVTIFKSEPEARVSSALRTHGIIVVWWLLYRFGVCLVDDLRVLNLRCSQRRSQQVWHRRSGVPAVRTLLGRSARVLSR